MQSEQQFEQLMMQYEQLKNGALDIASMIEKQDFDAAITMIKQREHLFLSCKTIRRYLELTPVQLKQADKILDEIKDLELKNIKKLEKGMEEIQLELARTQKSQKLQQAYGGNTQSPQGSILNIKN